MITIITLVIMFMILGGIIKLFFRATFGIFKILAGALPGRRSHRGPAYIDINCPWLYGHGCLPQLKRQRVYAYLV